jgi:hypothetical protein
MRVGALMGVAPILLRPAFTAHDIVTTRYRSVYDFGMDQSGDNKS